MNRSSHIGLAALLGLASMATAIGIDGTLPAMPAMATGLNTTATSVQLSLSLFMVGVALGQMLHGPVSDRLGRKPVLVAGLVMTAAIAAGCAVTTSVETLYILRFLHGVVASAGFVVARAVVRDRFERDHAARVLSLVLLFHGIAPIVAPVISAHLTANLGWRAVYASIAIYSIAIALLYLILFRESLFQPDRNALKLRPMMGNIRNVGRHPVFWAYTLCSAAGFGMLFSFLAASSHVIITFFGESETRYGYMFGGTMLGVLAGMFAGARLVTSMGSFRLLRLGAWMATLFALMLATLYLVGLRHWLAVIAPMGLCMVAFSLMVPQAIAGALQPFPRMAGVASSMIGFTQQLTGAVTGIAVASLTHGGTQTALALGVLSWSLVALIIVLFVIPRLEAVGD